MTSSRMRALIIIVLGVAIAVGQPTTTRASDAKLITVNPQTLKFIAIPDMPSCASAAVLRGNPRGGAAWVLLKTSSGCRVPWHWHTPNEDLLVISGQGTLEMKDGPPLRFVPGAYASMPSHHIHQLICTRQCLFFNGADAAFDIHYVDANGEEIPSDQALQQPAKPTPKPKRKKK